MLISPAVFTAEEEEKKYERDLHTEGPMKDFGAEPSQSHKVYKTLYQLPQMHIEDVMYLFKGRYYEYIAPTVAYIKLYMKNKYDPSY